MSFSPYFRPYRARNWLVWLLLAVGATSALLNIYQWQHQVLELHIEDCTLAASQSA